VLWLLCFATALADRDDALATIRVILLDTGFGAAWLMRLSALAVAVLAASAGPPGPVALASGVALACEGWTGHAAAFGAAGSLLQVAHVLCAAAWIGGLLPLGVLVMRGRRHAAPAAVPHTALERFSRVGLPVVLVLAATGVAKLERLPRRT
jgi:putative copper resistance protein D